MLFYNHKHEFIGIDEEGLKLLNYKSLEDLLEVCSDVADLFAKEPGYIHNFKSFSWIGFLLHADSDARSAIVHGNGRTFSCSLQVHNLFLCEEPGSNGYIVEMNHVQSISGDDIKPFTAPQKTVKETPAPIEPTVPASFETAPSVLPDYTQIPQTELSRPGTLDVPMYEENEFEPFAESKEELYPPFVPPIEEIEIEKPKAAEIPPVIQEPLKAPAPSAGRYTKAEQEFIDNLKVSPTYRFDPNVAAGELGLPVDLIQEFIGDFIQQSYDFKTDLFEAVLKGDMNNLKILSHKLKGVAANLRIEDAFETLTNVNTSDDPIEIEANLKHFYAIIAKLDGKESAPFISGSPAETSMHSNTETMNTPVNLDDDDIYAFEFKKHADEPLKAEAPAYQEESSWDVGTADSYSNEPEVESYLPESDIYPSEVEESISSEKEYFIPEEAVEPEIAGNEPVILPLHYDKNSVASSLGIDMDFLDELIYEYKSDALISSRDITDAVAAFDTSGWKKSAIQLKGISDNLRLNEISAELAILSETNDAQEAHKASKRLNGFIEQL